MGKLHLGQRVVVVVGLGVGLWVLGNYLVSAWGAYPTGWTGYAPVQVVVGTSPPKRLLIGLGLTAVWIVCSVLVLRGSKVANGRPERPEPPG